jgi:hypothetical protein
VSRPPRVPHPRDRHLLQLALTRNEQLQAWSRSMRDVAVSLTQWAQEGARLWRELAEGRLTAP